MYRTQCSQWAIRQKDDFNLGLYQIRLIREKKKNIICFTSQDLGSCFISIKFWFVRDDFLALVGLQQTNEGPFDKQIFLDWCWGALILQRLYCAITFRPINGRVNAFGKGQVSPFLLFQQTSVRSNTFFLFSILTKFTDLFRCQETSCCSNAGRHGCFRYN